MEYFVSNDGQNRNLSPELKEKVIHKPGERDSSYENGSKNKAQSRKNVCDPLQGEFHSHSVERKSGLLSQAFVPYHRDCVRWPQLNSY